MKRVLLIVLLVAGCEAEQVKEDFSRTKAMLEGMQEVKDNYEKGRIDALRYDNDIVANQSRDSIEALNPIIDSLVHRLEVLSSQLK